MDRDGIQRRDFPTGRRGYDPAAVDEHLRRVADAFETNTPLPAPSFAASTSDQVREILEAAERSVASVRAEASREASDHVTEVQQATAGMLSKLDELESELGRLLTALRASGERLAQGLEQLQADVAGTAPSPPAADAPAPVTPLSSDDSGARLIALNMALSGSSREETAAYLAEHFELADPDALLDDVYARAGR
ncbi:DivIVA domain-containing protein [Solirubrobacter taibaiensis]|nr:DivIVA domain-containing protein [Solirubrobacter taibaiensis]